MAVGQRSSLGALVKDVDGSTMERDGQPNTLLGVFDDVGREIMKGDCRCGQLVGMSITELRRDGQESGIDSCISDVAGDFKYTKEVAAEVRIVHPGPKVGVLAFAWRRKPL